jgi:predicted SprT family Zn-dependent metalloprotease
VLEDVIPHEVAHLVCMLRPQHGHSHAHDEGWAKVARRLGGSGLAHYPPGAFDL